MKLFKNLELHEKKNYLAYENSISYKQLNNSINFLANKINEHTKSYSKILIIGDNNIFSYSSILACLKSYRTYIPLSLSTPKKRIEQIIKLTKPSMVLSNSLKYAKLKNFYFLKKKIFSSQDNFIATTSKNNIAYIIFTSGSSGIPKGVCISRKSLMHFLEWYTKSMKIKNNDRCSQIPQIGFDLSVADILGNLNSGGNIFPLKNNFYKLFPQEFLFDNKISYLVCVPSFIDLFEDTKDPRKKLKYLKKIYFCGEMLRKHHVEKIFKKKRDIKIINSYGPTEATVSCSEILLNSENYKNFHINGMSIGKPIRNMKFFIKKINGKKNEGELIISGPQVAECYLNNKELNEEKFMKKNRKKFYLTGDVVFKKNGHYFFKFRNDFQIKIRGYRVELPEIDNLIKKKMISLNSFSLFLKGKIITFLYKPKFNKIRIYFFLRKYLPNYMIPNDLVFLKKIPTNVNGKIDLKKISKNYAKR